MLAVLSADFLVDALRCARAVLPGSRPTSAQRMGRVLVLHLAIIFGMWRHGRDRIAVRRAVRADRAEDAVGSGCEQRRREGRDVAGGAAGLGAQVRRHRRQGQGRRDGNAGATGSARANRCGARRSRTRKSCRPKWRSSSAACSPTRIAYHRRMDRYERISTLHRILKTARYPVPLARLMDELELLARDRVPRHRVPARCARRAARQRRRPGGVPLRHRRSRALRAAGPVAEQRGTAGAARAERTRRPHRARASSPARWRRSARASIGCCRTRPTARVFRSNASA